MKTGIQRFRCFTKTLDIGFHRCDDFLRERQYKHKRSSHHILIYPGARRAVVIPEYDEIDSEIIKNNMKTVGMKREDYFQLLKRV